MQVVNAWPWEGLRSEYQTAQGTDAQRGSATERCVKGFSLV